MWTLPVTAQIASRAWVVCYTRKAREAAVLATATARRPSDPLSLGGGLHHPVSLNVLLPAGPAFGQKISPIKLYNVIMSRFLCVFDVRRYRYARDELDSS
jgi:hypothetical protein